MNPVINLKCMTVALATLIFGLALALCSSMTVQGGEWHHSPNVSTAPTATVTAVPQGPTLYISYREGAPGSVFTLTGLDFPASEQVSVWINGHLIATMEAVPGYSNWFIFHLDTLNASEGISYVVAQTQSITTRESFTLDSSEPTRQPLEEPVFDDAPMFLVPSDIAFTDQAFLPLIVKQ